MSGNIGCRFLINAQILQNTFHAIIDYIESNITAYIPNFGQYKPFREGFVFDAAHERYTCAAKSVYLPYKETCQDKKGYYKKQYRISAKDCGHCPLRASCIGGRADYKKIEDTVDKYLYDEMHLSL